MPSGMTGRMPASNPRLKLGSAACCEDVFEDWGESECEWDVEELGESSPRLRLLG